MCAKLQFPYCNGLNFVAVINDQVYSSRLLADAVEAFAALPGIGRKTALRLVMHLIKKEESKVISFAETVAKMRSEIQFCKECHNLSDGTICTICANELRDRSKICVVEDIRDVITIEGTGAFGGLYHVLGGLLSPLDGIGPEQLHLSDLPDRCRALHTQELIMALSPNIEGDTTMYYISKLLKDHPVEITSLARGVSFGSELEYTDDVTLGKSIAKRLPVNLLMG